MLGKIIIHTDLKVLTGLHIGGSDAFAAIGAISSPVIRDKRTQYPIVPGSSLQGKLRTLLVRSMQQMDKPENDPDNIKHLFGSINPIVYSRLQFADVFLKNKDEFKSINDTTEAKFENSIDRINCQAMPRH
jgi:CRISPR-associated protein Csm3